VVVRLLSSYLLTVLWLTQVPSHEFMHRTELCFRALHDRITWLEERVVWQGAPSDEQVERVLRKILAEKCT
jgi:hypothetical protein